MIALETNKNVKLVSLFPATPQLNKDHEMMMMMKRRNLLRILNEKCDS
jgi:hypothetical protein